MPAVHCVAVIVAGHCAGVDGIAAVGFTPDGSVDAVEMIVGVGIESLADFAEAVIGEEVEQPVLHDRSADRTAELLLLVHRLREKERRGRGSDAADAGVQRLVLRVRVQSIQRGIAQEVEQVAVHVVGAALGDGVHLAAGRLAEFDGVVRGLAWNSLMESTE